MAPIAGPRLPAATPVAGGNTVGIPLARFSGDAGTGDIVPGSGRPATDIEGGGHPVGGKGTAGHGGDMDPNRSSFI
jgi:hypothetical protein